MRNVLLQGLALAVLVCTGLDSYAQTISIFAGDVGYGYSGDGGPARNAEIYEPHSVAVDAAGNVLIADEFNNRIRKVDIHGTITTVAGNGYICCFSTNDGGYTGDHGSATSAELNHPQGIAVDAAGNIYIADYENNVIREVDTSGIITTVAGGGHSNSSGIPATTAFLNYAPGVGVDANGNLLIADESNNRICRVDSLGFLTVIAGQDFYNHGFTGDGGAATLAELYGPQAVTADAAGNVYIADTKNNRVRNVTIGGVISTVAGNGTGGSAGDGGFATSAAVGSPQGVAVDAKGNIYISQYDRIRMVDTNGIITTFAGGGTGSDIGPAKGAILRNAMGLAVDAHRNLYIAVRDSDAVLEVHQEDIFENGFDVQH